MRIPIIWATRRTPKMLITMATPEMNSGYNTTMLERRIQKRVIATNSVGIKGYLGFLKGYPEE